ncbi:MAG: hypothetical protein MR924_06245 [Prevotella sp.]|nr:hypothetical protein [Prevotella sp.]
MARIEDLPESFVSYTRETMGEELFAAFVSGLGEEAPVSIRVNRAKWDGDVVHGERVPWSADGYYLPDRPNFTFDPLLHAGCYYVQEASSMFVERVLGQYVTEPVEMLDMCAAPGGKSLAAIATLPEGSWLMSNEPIRQRASVLAENVSKWGSERMVVVNNYPEQISKSKLKFDVILCDVPCSGEGMFRKDAQAISEWSVQNVEKCRQLQREIVAEAWKCLRPGGLLIYSTCTFNTRENEENVRWIMDEYGAEILPVDIREEWNVVGSLLAEFDGPVYRFIPGVTRGEGIFMAVMRKDGEWKAQKKPSLDKLPPMLHRMELTRLSGEGKDTAPRVEIDYDTAIAYLRREAIRLPDDSPRGIITLTYRGVDIGQAKNIGNRANNLYPKEWRIKSTHVPEGRGEILKN